MTLAVMLLVLTGLLAERRWDVTRLIVAGSRYARQSALQTRIAVLPNAPGYDGQFYYRLALNPFTAQVTQFGLSLDNPPLRGQRILYPLLAWALALGQAGWVPWTLVAINLASFAALALLATDLARRRGLPAAYGLVVPFYPGFLLTMARDTTELLASALAFAALWCAVQRRFALAGLAAGLAVLARETTLLYLAGFGLVALAQALRGRRWSWNVAALATPLIVYLLWHRAVGAIWGGSPLPLADIDLIPLDGLWQFVVRASALPATFGRPKPLPYQWMTIAFCLYACALGLACLPRPQIPAGLKISWLFYVILVLLFSAQMWGEPWAYLRVFCDCYLLGAALVLLAGQRIWRLSLGAGAAAIWMLTARFLLADGTMALP